MNKNLINSKREFYELMRKHYWNNPEFTDERADHASYISRPEKYPCVVVHKHRIDDRGRESELVEFIYLSDFDEACNLIREVKERDRYSK
jgi:hypothetical protein